MTNSALRRFIEDSAIGAIAAYLQQKKIVNELTLMRLIEGLPKDGFDFSDDPVLKIFEKHFIVRHCLYVLQQQWFNTGRALLDIDIIEIHVSEFSSRKEAQNKQMLVGSTNKITSEYYLNLRNLFAANHDSIKKMFAEFNQRHAAMGNEENALRTLGLEKRTTLEEIKKEFRRKAATCHPDKGGSAAEFEKLTTAFNILKLLHKNKTP